MYLNYNFSTYSLTHLLTHSLIHCFWRTFCQNLPTPLSVAFFHFDFSSNQGSNFSMFQMLLSIIFKVTALIVYPLSFLLYSKHILSQIKSCFEDYLSLYSNCIVCPLWLLVCSEGPCFLSSLWIVTCYCTMCVNFLFTHVSK